MHRSRPTAVLLALVLGLAACGRTSDTDAARAAPAVPSDTDAAPLDTDAAPAVPSAYDWSAPTVAGGDFDLAALAEGPVVLWMWAPWCSVCNREAVEIGELLVDLPEDVTLVGVAGRDDVAPMQDFVARHGLGDMVHAVDVDGSLWARYGVSYQPAWVLITPDGQVAVAAGALGRAGVLDAVAEVFGT